MLDRPGHASALADLDDGGLGDDIRAPRAGDSCVLRCHRPHNLDEEQGSCHESAC